MGGLCSRCDSSLPPAFWRWVIDGVLVLPDNHQGYADGRGKYVFILLSGGFTGAVDVQTPSTAFGMDDHKCAFRVVGVCDGGATFTEGYVGCIMLMSAGMNGT